MPTIRDNMKEVLFDAAEAKTTVNIVLSCGGPGFTGEIIEADEQTISLRQPSGNVVVIRLSAVIAVELSPGSEE